MVIKAVTDQILWRFNDFWRRMDYLRAKIEFKFSESPKIDPYKLYFVNPENINKTTETNELEFKRLSPVVAGDWDLNHEDLENFEIIYSIKNHFIEEKPWEQTDFYSTAERAIKEEEEWIGRINLKNIDQFKHYLTKIDKLYTDIDSDGYKKQKQIENDFLYHTPTLVAYERHEVTINIARDGKMLLEDGWHRLAIAKALNLKLIPVRIKLRHKQWQEKRKRKYKSGENHSRNHPDLSQI